MTLISSDKDPEALTLTLVAEFDAPAERVWQVWEDPRQLERWWGPPTWPATFEQHEPVPGGSSRYFMTGPDGEKARGWWSTTAVESPHRFEFDDGFADDDGNPTSSDLVTHVAVTIDALDGDRSRMTVLSSFLSLEVLDQMVDMGMQEGMGQAIGQIDALVAETADAR